MTPFFLALTLLLTLLPPSTSHSFMVFPNAYNRVFKTKSCSGSECTQACPNFLSRGQNNFISSPAANYSRGETVVVKWAKNNHRGGLVRVALVPVHKLMSRTWHNRLSLWYGCWESGEFTCSGDECGSDTDREAFKRTFTIPSVFPDGDYVLAVLWMGGLHYSRTRGMFPDYFSCSFVRVRGGDTLGGSYQPFWKPGDTGKFQNGDLCQSAADAPGDCPHDRECFNPAKWTVAKVFKNGNKPARITPGVVADAFAARPNLKGAPSSPRTAPPATTKPAGGDNRSGRQPPSTTRPTTTTRTTRATTKGTRVGTRSNGGRVNGPRLCTGRVCCPQKCGVCGGGGCHRRPGGGENCCYTKIDRSGRVCGRDAPPCVRG